MLKPYAIDSAKSSDVSTLATGASIALFGRLGGRGLAMLTMIIFARTLGPTLFGLFAISWALIRIVALITPLGLDKGVIRFGALSIERDEQDNLGQVIKWSFLLALCAGIVATAILVALAQFIEQAYDKPSLAQIIRLFAIVLPVISMLRVGAAATRMTQRTQFSVLAEDLVQPAMHLALFLGAFLLGWQLLGAIVTSILSFVIALLVILFFVFKLFPNISWLEMDRKYYHTVKSLLKYSLPITLAGSFALSITWIDQLFVGYYLPSSDAGIYQAALQISVLFALVMGSFTAIVAPMVASSHAKGDIGRLEEIYRVTTKWGAYINLPALLVIVFAAEEILTLLYGPSYASGWLALTILMAGQLVNVLTGTVAPLLTMTGHQYRWFFISGIAFFVNVILNIMFIPQWGLAGAAFGTAVATAILFSLALIQARRLLHIHVYDYRIVKSLLAAGVAAIIILLCQPFLQGNAFTTICAFTLIAYGVQTGMLLLFGLDAEDKQVINQLKSRMFMNRS
ncbi:MAG: flippase [Anaerolineae bacterium]|nr:flippase [Anaerolineae bacterium]MCO5194156.1 flippase [Anaerolineae bacterium]MCO5205409.1 flippase [Anaerolineae bacterium]